MPSIRDTVAALPAKLAQRKEVQQLVELTKSQGQRLSSALARARAAQTEAEESVAAERRKAIVATVVGVPGGALVGGVLDGVTGTTDAVVRPSTVLGLIVGGIGAGFGFGTVAAAGAGMCAGGFRSLGESVGRTIRGEAA